MSHCAQHNQGVLSCEVRVSTKSYEKLKKLSGLADLSVFWFYCPLLFYLWYSPAIRSYPNSKYWLHVNSLGSSISWGCRSFLKVLLLRLLKHWEVTEKQEIKKNPKTEVVVPNHKLNIKALSSCHAALLYHNSLPVEELWCFTLTCFTNVNCKHFCGLSSLDTAGVCTWSFFLQKSMESCRHWGGGAASVPPGAPLGFLASPRCQQELQHLLLNLEIFEKGKHKFTLPCWAGKWFCLLSSSQIAGL